MSGIRKIFGITKSTPTREGAGVYLKRAFGQADPALDPFLLLDDFGSADPADYVAGFPWHPHRGIETITYLISGSVVHGDSLGNKGIIRAGDVQWMTAGSGIVHEEMPQSEPDLRGFQLWSNLPAANKMMPPRYRDVKAGQIPEAKTDGATINVICGEIAGVKGPVTEIVTDPLYFDVTVRPGAVFTHAIKRGHNAFAYVIEGRGAFGDEGQAVDAGRLAVFEDGDEVKATAGADGVRFLLVAGQPIREPVAWGGPIVMNTEAELQTAFEEYNNGTFIK